MKKNIFLAGHNGMVGTAIHKLLSKNKELHIVTREKSKLNLLNQSAVSLFFENEEFDEIYMCAAKVGGIHANDTYPADFIYENLTVQNNIIHSANTCNIQKILFLGSSCIYPKLANQPIKEDELLMGKLEPTNEPYAIAKIAGIKMCEAYNRQFNRDYRSVMPTNLYGENDNFHPKNAHVIPALLQRFHEAVMNDFKEVVLWGSGSPKREFLHVNDMASACIHIMDMPQKEYQNHISNHCSHINIGSGMEYSIKQLAEIISEITMFKGHINFDTSKPDGTPRKLLDSTLLRKSNWSPSIRLKEGLESTYQWYKKNLENIRQ